MPPQNPQEMVLNVFEEARAHQSDGAGSFTADIGTVAAYSSEEIAAATKAFEAIRRDFADDRLTPEIKANLKRKAIAEAKAAIDDAQGRALLAVPETHAKAAAVLFPERDRSTTEAAAVERELGPLFDDANRQDEFASLYTREFKRAAQAGDDATLAALAGRWGQLRLERALGTKTAKTVRDAALAEAIGILAQRPDLSHERKSAASVLHKRSGPNGLHALPTAAYALAEMILSDAERYAGEGVV
jgi:hypothetical protein